MYTAITAHLNCYTLHEPDCHFATGQHANKVGSICVHNVKLESKERDDVNFCSFL